MNKTFRKLQVARSLDQAQKARSVTMQWQSARAECARNLRMRPRRSRLRAAGADLGGVRRATGRMLHRVVAMLRCLLHSQRCRRDRECDESRLGALRALSSWRESPRL